MLVCRRGSALELVAPGDIDGLVVVVEVQSDRQGDGSLGGGQHDDEQRNDLAVEAKTGVPGEGDEIDVGPDENQFDAHQHRDPVPLGGHADHSGDEHHRTD